LSIKISIVGRVNIEEEELEGARNFMSTIGSASSSDLYQSTGYSRLILSASLTYASIIPVVLSFIAFKNI
jgi:hypothetical protein